MKKTLPPQKARPCTKPLIGGTAEPSHLIGPIETAHVTHLVTMDMNATDECQLINNALSAFAQLPKDMVNTGRRREGRYTKS